MSSTNLCGVIIGLTVPRKARVSGSTAPSCSFRSSRQNFGSPIQGKGPLVSVEPLFLAHRVRFRFSKEANVDDVVFFR